MMVRCPYCQNYYEANIQLPIHIRMWHLDVPTKKLADEDGDNVWKDA